MALQVWLPLNGDLYNQGIDQNVKNTSNSGATINNNGKIGKCYSFDGADDWIQWSINKEDYSNKPLSFCCWFKSDKSKSTGCIIDIAADLCLGYNYNSNNITFYYWRVYGTSSSRSGDSNTTTNSFDANLWHHVVAVYDNTTNKIYVDGILQNTWQSKSQAYWVPLLAASYNKLSIGKSAGSTSWIGGLVNDVRIYDHALNDKEIEEISKGLVLHYQLNDTEIEPTINLCNGSTCGTQASSASPSTWGGHKYYTVLQNKTNNDPVPFSQKSVMTIDFSTSYGSGGGASVYPPTSFVVSPSTTYIYSKYIKPSDNFSYTSPNFLYRYEYASSGGSRLIEGGIFNKNNIEYIGNGWYRCWGTFTTQATTAYLTLPFYTYPGKSMTYELGGIQLEAKSHITPYVSSNRTKNIIYDTSGYNNNGTIVGEMTIYNSSPKYNNTIKQANGQYIRVNNQPAVCMPKDAITVNLWQYATSWSNPISCTEGGGWNFENSNGIRFPVYISGVGYKVAQSSITTTQTLNAWHMLTGTMDKDNIKIYYDGEEVGTVANGSVNGIGYANNYIFIGAEAQGNNITPAGSGYAGEISDVRIYATALTSAQIKELYETSKIVDGTTVKARDLEVSA